MDKNGDYRNEFYRNYISEHWAYAEKISSDTYDFYSKVYRHQLREVLPADKNIKILDLACGTGYLLNFLSTAGYKNITGVDIGPEQVELSKKVDNVKVICSDIFDFLEKTEDKYDLIFCVQLIEHMTKYEAIILLRNIRSHLNKNGKVVLLTPNVMSYGGMVAAFGDFTHEIIFTNRSLSQLIRASGFGKVSVTGCGPVVHDLRSSLRYILYKTKNLLKHFEIILDRGTGRSIWKGKVIIDPLLLGVGTLDD